MNRSLCIDGTAACLKTTILLNLQSKHFNIQKINKVSLSTDINSLGPAALGYITRGIRLLNTPKVTFFDRSPLNCVEWHVLWSLFDVYQKTFGNVKPSDVKHTAEWKLFVKDFNLRFDMLKDAVWYKDFSSKINRIAIIDSNVENVRRRMANRNRPSDIIRSNWLFYPDLQNMMYRNLYLQVFDVSDYEDVDTFSTSIIHHLIMYSKEMEIMPYTCTPTTFHLPTAPLDLQRLNMHSHIFRSLGKIYVKDLKVDIDRLFPREWSCSWTNENGQKVSIINATATVGPETNYCALDDGEAFDDDE